MADSGNRDVRERALRLASAAERRSPGTIAVARSWARRFFEVEGIDRSIVLGAQAFTALLPLLIVYASVAPHATGRDFADGAIDRFDLSGATAESFRRASSRYGVISQMAAEVAIVTASSIPGPRSIWMAGRSE